MYVKNIKNEWIWNNEYFKDAHRKNGIVVATDFDGVITNPHELKSKELQTLGFSILPEETSRRYCIEIKEVPEKIYESVTFKINVSNLLSVPLEKNAKEVIARISNDDGMIFVVTSRFDHEMPSLFRYLDKNDLQVDGVINTNRNNKLHTLINIKPDIYIDDTLEKLYELFINSDSVQVHPALVGCKLILHGNSANGNIKNLRVPINDVKRGWEEIGEILLTLGTFHELGKED